MTNTNPAARIISRQHASAGIGGPRDLTRLRAALACAGLALACALPVPAVLAAGAPREAVNGRERNEFAQRLPIEAGALQDFDARRVAVSSSGLSRAKAGGTVVTVTSADDPVDIYGFPTYTTGTLRWAINFVNSQCFYGPYTIAFAIAGTPPVDTVINVAAGNPMDTVNCNGTLIDGYTQTGMALDGSSLVSFGSGLDIGANDIEVRGLSIYRMPGNGITTFCGGSNSVFAGNYLGTDSAGTTGLGNGGYGISVGETECGGVDNTVIDGNVIVYNAAGGILVDGGFSGGGTPPNQVIRNHVAANGGPGMRIVNDTGTLIGSMADPAMFNEFIGNAGAGVEVIGATGQQFGINYTSGNLGATGSGFDVSLLPAAGDGPTFNDTGDSSPPQNYPVFSTITFDTATGLMRVQGFLDTSNAGPFTVLVYGDNALKHYEAGAYLGQFTVPAGGAFDQSIPYDIVLLAGQYGGITANATSAAAGAQSSEISGAMELPYTTQSATTLNFGNVPIGTTATQSVNVSTAAGFFQVLSATPPAGFTVDASTCVLPAASAAKASSCVISVTFAPTVAGAAGGNLDFVSNSAGMQRIALAGTGTVVPIAVTWSFSQPSVIAGNPVTLSMQLGNLNNASFSGSGSFTYTLPAGLVAATPPNPFNAPFPCGGTITPATDGLSFTVAGVSIPTTAACAFGLDVTSAAPSTYPVSMGAGVFSGTVLSATNVPNAASNVASLVVSPVPVPLLAISPAPPGPLAFGAVTVGTFSAYQVVTLTNAGSLPLAFSGPPVVTGAFEVKTATATPCPATLPPAPGPGNSCTVEVRFAPTVVTAAAGTLAIASNGGSGTLDLTGTGSAAPQPAIGFTPSSLSFSPQVVGTTSSPLVVTLSNPGTAPLAISAMGTTVGDFGTSSNCPIAPATLAPGGTCTISVTFTPLITGNRIGTLDVSSNAAGGTGQVSLSGQGTVAPVPAVSASPSPMSFPPTQVGTTSAPQSVVVTNTGGAPLTISVVEIIGSGFGIVSNGCSGTIAAGADCVITLVFAPPSPGTNAATLRIISNAPASPTFVGLSGAGSAAPVATLSAAPSSLAFAVQVVGTTSSPLSVTIANAGGVTATISSVTVSGDYAQSNNCASVPPDGSCTISVTFTPMASGARTGTLLVAGDASNAPVAIPLSGTGAPPPVPVVELSVTSLSFGNALVGRGLGPQAVTLRNVGGAPLSITGIGTPYEFPVTSGCPSVVPAGESCRLDVGFLPGIPGARSGRMDVFSNASNGTRGVELSGTGCRFSFLARNLSLVCQ